MISALIAGCQGPQPPVFPPVEPRVVYPPAPNQPRIEYIGQLTGEADLHARPGGWDAFRTVFAGPDPQAVFIRPAAIATIGQTVFVADTGAAAVHRLDIDRREYELIVGPPGERFELPIDLVPMDGEVGVLDRKRRVVDFFAPSGAWQRAIVLDDLQAPVAAAWDARHEWLWIADAVGHAVVAVDQTGAPQRGFGRRGAGAGMFNFPTAIAFGEALGVAVADAMNFRIQVFDPETTRPRLVFGQKGDAAGDFARPRSVAIDSAQNLYVLDNQFENVQVFNRDGQLLMAFGGSGAGVGEFALPADIFIDKSDRIWIADSYNRRVQVFQFLAEEQT
jgi:DNA-binding beta-propeller fold protein YncE